MLGIAGGALAFTKKRYVHFLLAMAISVMALRSARALPIAAIILLPLANGAIAATIDLPWRDYAKRLRALDTQFLGLGTHAGNPVRRAIAAANRPDRFLLRTTSR